MPPGLGLFSVSEKAFQRAEQVNGRGYYFDFLEFRSNHAKGMTPSTPVIPLIHALRYTLDKIFQEGVENRFKRHAELNKMVHNWVEKHGFELFPQKQFASKSLTCVKNNLISMWVGLLKSSKKPKRFPLMLGMAKSKVRLSGFLIWVMKLLHQ